MDEEDDDEYLTADSDGSSCQSDNLDSMFDSHEDSIDIGDALYSVFDFEEDNLDEATLDTDDPWIGKYALFSFEL